MLLLKCQNNQCAIAVSQTMMPANSANGLIYFVLIYFLMGDLLRYNIDMRDSRICDFANSALKFHDKSPMLPPANFSQTGAAKSFSGR